MTTDDSVHEAITAEQLPSGRLPVAELIVLRGAIAGQRFSVESVAEMGRSAEASILIDHEQVSRVHARISRNEAGAFQLEDLGSRNGTFVNDMRVQRRLLAIGDRIRLGTDVELEFSISDGVMTRLAERQRFEVVGRLGLGLAQDVNDLHAAVKSGATFLRGLAGSRRLDDPEVQQCLGDLVLAATRSDGFARTLMDFARVNRGQRAAVDLAELGEHAAGMLQLALGSDVNLQYQLSGGAIVNGNRSELLQLLLHLCFNARDAMPQGGTLAVHVGRLQRVQDARLGLATDRAFLRVSDTGVGMSEATRKRLMEPASAANAGSNGLFTVPEIVAAHGGTLEVESVAGEGTHVIIYLPAIDPRSLRHNSTIEQPRVSTRTGKVLLVDDDGVIRRMLGRMLRQSGFSVAEVDHGDEAIAHIRSSPMDVAVIDVKVAGGDPIALHRALEAACPGIRSVLISRQAAPELESGKRSAICAVRKPFTFDYLLTVVERMLQQAQEDGDSTRELDGRYFT